MKEMNESNCWIYEWMKLCVEQLGSRIVFGWVKGGCKPQATSPKRRLAPSPKRIENEQIMNERIEWVICDWTMKRGSHNGRVGWAEWSWICWWVKGAAAPRQPAQRRDERRREAKERARRQKQELSLFSLSWIGCLFSHEMKWNEEKQAMEKRRTNQLTNPSAQCARQANSSSFFSFFVKKKRRWKGGVSFFNQSNGMKIDWLCCPLIQLRWYAAVAGYGLLAQQQLILHSSLIDWLVCLFFN